MSKTNCRWARRKQRRDEAQIRQEEYDALSTKDKIARTVSSTGNSRRQFKRFANAAEAGVTA